MLIGVAGHVDHGKTALVEALTGINADRLPEERRRGMTIDLGFAYAAAGDGRILGFVDLPGHERFLHNFLAGALALDRILLVVAADEGVRAQTLEHLAILERIGVRRLTAVISKIDQAPPDRVAEVEADVRGRLAAAGFADAAIMAVSSRSGQGIAALRAFLEATAEPAADVGRRFRMPIDRAFSLTGVGLVVTGAVVAGEVAVGAQLLLSPSGVPARVRSLHAQNQEATSARAGQRCGLAIAGRFDPARVRRGDWLVDPGLHAPADRILVRVRAFPGATVRPGRLLRLHHAAAAVSAKAYPLGEGAGDAPFPVHLTLARPIAALHGDRLVLRDPATKANLAAGWIIDSFAPERRALRRHTPATLMAMGEEDPAVALAARLAAEGAVDVARFALSRNRTVDSLAGLAGPDVVRLARGDVWLSRSRAQALREGVLQRLAEVHRRHPDRLGLNVADLARLCADQAGPLVAQALIDDLLAVGAIRRSGGVVHLPGHAPRLAERDEALWARLAERFEDAGLRPPTVAELAGEVGLDRRELRAALDRMQYFGHLALATANRAFLPETLGRLRAVAEALSRSSPDGLFSAAQFNHASGIGRNLTIEILEYFDRQGVTERVGDLRRMNPKFRLS
jgi:selenocysteine-specific elongation factor